MILFSHLHSIEKHHITSFSWNRRQLLASSMAVGLLHLRAFAEENSIDWQIVAADNLRVPQTLLKLIHTREVQQEIALDEHSPFLAKLQEIDGPWWRSRHLPLKEQRKIIADQEEKLLVELRRFVSPSLLTRLRKIELQSQGWRMLVRPDVSHWLQLNATQLTKLEGLFKEVDELASRSASQPGKPDDRLAAQWKQAKAKEDAEAGKVLTTAQQVKLKGLLEPLIDTSRFERIYPLAPELIDSGSWASDQPVRLLDLRGRIALVHFYAFQCHNCVANFEHYKRWHRDWGNRGVSVVGIQTPETSAEKDPRQVIQAARKEKFEFPVLIDLEAANWKAWGNSVWPTIYVVDQAGYIRMWWQGELNWNGATGDRSIEQMMEKLLNEKQS